MFTQNAIVTLILAALVTASVAPAKADQLDTATTVLSGITVVDSIQTQTWFHGGRFPCAAVGPSLFQPSAKFPANATCYAYEADPLARPFVGTWTKQIGSMVVTDSIVWLSTRLIRGQARKTWAHIMQGVDFIYTAGIVIPNQRIIQAQR